MKENFIYSEVNTNHSFQTQRKFADLGSEEKEKKTSEGNHQISSSPTLGSKC